MLAIIIGLISEASSHVRDALHQGVLTYLMIVE